jgi:iron complex transport system ATP-binding protein
MPEALTAQAVSVRRGMRVVLTDITFEVRHGSLLAITGPNGAGKTTLLKALLGIVPSSGQIRVGGVALAGLDPRSRARLVAYVPQRSELLAGISVYDAVAQARYAHRVRWFGRAARPADPWVERALRQTHLSSLRERAFDTLSGGEQRRVLLARALASEARILALDEPTAGLDVAHVLRFYELLGELRREGYALVSVLHDLADVTRYADQALLLDRGRTVARGPTPEVLSPERVRAVYGVHAHAHANLGFSLGGVWP